MRSAPISRETGRAGLLHDSRRAGSLTGAVKSDANFKEKDLVLFRASRGAESRTLVEVRSGLRRLCDHRPKGGSPTFLTSAVNLGSERIASN
jgi:hypothetical protein